MFRVGTEIFLAPRGLRWLANSAPQIADDRVRAFIILRVLVPVSRRTITNVARSHISGAN